MIISASYKTDIPTFYGDWFLQRLKEGCCGVSEPYTSRVRRVSLRPGDVDGIVFWTKNVGPFVPALEQVRGMGFPFVVHHTINGYPREFEHRVVDAERSCQLLRGLSGRYGQRSVVWRYDTIIVSTLTDAEWHRANFSRLACALRGVTDEVVVSFLQLYKKTVRGLDAAAEQGGFRWWDPSDEEKKALCTALAAVAADNGMRLTICGQPQLLQDGVGEARCIDAVRLSDVAGRPVVAQLGGSRKKCGCYQATDIGAYNTCPHGCVYCYAVSSEARARELHRRHDPNSPYLDPTITDPLPEEDPDASRQLALW